MEDSKLSPEAGKADGQDRNVRSTTVLHWLLELFDPPPLASLTFSQKIGRVLLLSSTLVIGSVLVSMLGALGLYLMERGRELASTPEFYTGVGIILIGVGINAICLAVLLQIKKADHKLIPPKAGGPLP